MEKTKVFVEGREWVEIRHENGHLCAVFGQGNWDFLQEMEQVRRENTGHRFGEINVTGSSVFSVLFREALLRAQGKWTPPYSEDELCHCRGIPTAMVRDAICIGHHDVEAIARITSAGTGCGTCRPESEKLIRYFCCVSEDEA